MTRTILITGANNGIGLALTRSLLDTGDRVAALDLSLKNLPRTPNLFAFVCDVTDPDRVQAVVDEVAHQWGGVDILINNACLALFTPFDERTWDDIRREFDVNYFGYLNLIRAVLPGMKSGDMVSSTTSVRGLVSRACPATLPPKVTSKRRLAPWHWNMLRAESSSTSCTRR